MTNPTQTGHEQENTTALDDSRKIPATLTGETASETAPPAPATAELPAAGVQGNCPFATTASPLPQEDIMSQAAQANANAVVMRNLAHTSCNDCSLSPICLPLAVDEDDLARLDSIIQRARPLRRGEHVYRENAPFQSIYAVRAGAVKAYTTTDTGEEQVTGFYLPGEILGMDGIHTDRHASSAVALETTSVCEIPFASLQELSRQIPSLQHHFFRMMSREIQEDQQLMLLLSKKTAEARIASLLVSFSGRYKRRKLSDSRFRLPMSRNDIGNYLGLAVETVSRVFTRFQKQNILEAEGKELQIIDHHKLCEISMSQAE